MPHVIRCSGVGVRRDGRMILQGVDWQIDAAQHWVVVGANGAGKSTLARIVAGQLFPTMGEVALLGSVIGRVDMAVIRRRVGWFSAELLRRIPHRETVRDAILTGARGVTGRWREHFTAEEETRCERLMDEWGIAVFADQVIGALSTGEQVRTLIARTLMPEPDVLVLDEPTAGLDIAGREDFVLRMRSVTSVPTVMVSHHLEEIPANTSHALLMRQGSVLVQGPIDATLTSESMSECFGLPLTIGNARGRWQAFRHD